MNSTRSPGEGPAKPSVRISNDRRDLPPWSLVIELRGVPCATLHPHLVPMPSDSTPIPGVFVRLWRWAFGSRGIGHWEKDERQNRALARAIFGRENHGLLDTLSEGEITSACMHFIGAQAAWGAVIAEAAGKKMKEALRDKECPSPGADCSAHAGPPASDVREPGAPLDGYEFIRPRHALPAHMGGGRWGSARSEWENGSQRGEETG